MKQTRHWWSQVPVSIRKPIVFVIGSTFILGAAATGWLPGPGGIPLFLIGIAILATEFMWAERFRDYILAIIRRIGAWWRRHKLIGTLTFMLCAICSATIAYFLYRITH